MYGRPYKEDGGWDLVIEDWFLICYNHMFVSSNDRPKNFRLNYLQTVISHKDWVPGMSDRFSSKYDLDSKALSWEERPSNKKSTLEEKEIYERLQRIDKLSDDAIATKEKYELKWLSQKEEVFDALTVSDSDGDPNPLPYYIDSEWDRDRDSVFSPESET
jgi:hypothetical protein